MLFSVLLAVFLCTPGSQRCFLPKAFFFFFFGSAAQLVGSKFPNQQRLKVGLQHGSVESQPLDSQYLLKADGSHSLCHMKAHMGRTVKQLRCRGRGGAGLRGHAHLCRAGFALSTALSCPGPGIHSTWGARSLGHSILRLISPGPQTQGREGQATVTWGPNQTLCPQTLT